MSGDLRGDLRGLLERSLPAVVAIAFARLGHPAKARAVASAALAQAIESLPMLRDPSPDSFRRWACQLARDKARLRAPWPDRSTVTARQRELLFLRAAGLPPADICSLLRLSPEALNVRLSAARIALQASIMAKKETGGINPCQGLATRPSTSSPASSAGT